MRHLFFILILLVTTSANAVTTKDFLITLPGQWKQLAAPDSNFQIFKNQKSKTNEVAVAQLIRYPVSSRMGTTDLLAARDSIAKARETNLRHYAIGHYRIHSMESESSPYAEFESVITIEASYRSLNHQDVQVVERQYIARDHMVQVIYAEEQADIGDRGRIHNVLDNVKPRSARKSVASRIGDWLIGDRVFAGEVVKDTKTTGTVNTEKDIAIATPQAATALGGIKDLCDSLAPELRGSVNDKPLSLADFGENCKIGGKDVAAALLSVVKDFGKGVWDYQLPVSDIKNAAHETWEAGKSVYKYATDSAYRAETNSPALAMVELVKDSKKMVQQVATKAYEFITQNDPPFVCYKSTYKVQAVCGFISGMVAGGAFGKIAGVVAGKMPPGSAEVAKKITKTMREELSSEASDRAKTVMLTDAGGAQAAEAAKSGVSPSIPNTGTPGRAPAASIAAAPAVSDKPVKRSAKVMAARAAINLEEAATLPDDKRLARAEKLLGRKLSASDKEGILNAHNVAAGKQYKDLTPKDIAAKGRVAQSQTSLSADERRILMENGILGGSMSPASAYADAGTVRFADTNAVRANIVKAGDSKLPYADAETLLRAGKTEQASEYYREAAKRAGPNYRAAQDAYVKAGEIGEAALTLRGNQERMRSAMTAAKQERQRLMQERDNRSITNKGENSSAYYDHSIRNYDAWIEQIKNEMQTVH